MASATIAQLRGTDTADGSALLQSLLARPMGGFDPDAWHVMQERDNDLIRSELMHGTANKAFVYSFDIKGTKVNGISVVGARELASQYKGIKSRIVATIEKRFNPRVNAVLKHATEGTFLLNRLAGDDGLTRRFVVVQLARTAVSADAATQYSVNAPVEADLALAWDIEA